MSKRILYLADNHFLAYQVSQKTLVEVQRFSPDPTGEAAFIKYLIDDRKTPITWLVDTSQEEYQTAHLPHVSGKDRRHLLAHKMRRLFEYTPYVHGLVQGRESQGRGDDKVLFMALSNPALLQPWMNLLLTHKVPLVGIFSVPLLCERLLKSLVKAPYTLLIAHTPAINEHSRYGLRQSFFLHQHLQLSRLIPLNTLEPREYAKYVIDQVIKMQRYLESAKLLPLESNEPLTTVILTNMSLLAPLQQYSASANLGNLPLQIIDSHDFAHQLGWHLAKDDEVYLHQLVAYQIARYGRGLKNHYAQSIETRYFLYRKVRLAIHLTSLLVLASAATFSYGIWEKAVEVKLQGLEKSQQIEQRQSELQELRNKVPNLPLDILLIRNVVDVGLHLKSLHLLPRPTWEKLSQVLARHSNLLVQQLEWSVGQSPTELFSSLSTSGASNEDTDGETAGQSPTAPPPTDPNTQTNAPPDYFWEGLRVQGKISPFGENYQNALHLFEQFVADLRNQRADFSEVKALVSPYNPKRTLQGKIGIPNETLTAPFAVDILIKHTYTKKPS